MFKYILCCLILAAGQAIANPDYPIVGKPCPDFTLTDVAHHAAKTISPKDFRGKWLVLDFWSKGCSACVASFPKINQYQKDLQNDVQFVLVAQNNKISGDIKGMYEKFRQKQNLELPIAYDSTLFKQFGIQSVPHIVVIDPTGIVRAVTYQVSKEALTDMVNGKPAVFAKKESTFEQDAGTRQRFNLGKPFLISGNGGPDTAFLFRSVLAKWDGLDQSVTGIDQLVDRGMFQSSGLVLRSLYNFAYVGTSGWNSEGEYKDLYQHAILEMKDTSLFNSDFGMNRNIFTYSIMMPKERANRKTIMEAMQRDLKNYFGYDVSFETRDIPCWKVVATPEARNKLAAKKQPGKYSEGDHAGYKFYNIPVKNMLSIIWGYHYFQPPYVDATGITGNIDINLDALLSDFEDVKKVLHKNGLDLVLSTQPMRVMVIKDPAP